MFFTYVGNRDFISDINNDRFKKPSCSLGYRAFAKLNPDYWKADRAHFDELETTGIADATSRVVALNTGQIDAMNRFQLNLTHLLSKARDIQIINVTGTKHYSIPMLTDREPYNNNDVRLALKYAINREDLLKKIPGIEVDKSGNVEAYGDHQAQTRIDSTPPQISVDPLLNEIINKFIIIKFYIRQLENLNT